jgi:hypothetical protein
MNIDTILDGLRIHALVKDRAWKGCKPFLTRLLTLRVKSSAAAVTSPADFVYDSNEQTILTRTVCLEIWKPYLSCMHTCDSVYLQGLHIVTFAICAEVVPRESGIACFAAFGSH